ncbi:MAG: PASTA domain-containing protein [Bacteroidota bacterium]
MSGSFFSFVRSKLFVYNLAAAILLLSIVIFFLQNWLGAFTHHGESITVPDVRGMNMERLEKFLAENQLEYEVVDSLYETGRKPGVVIDQDPAPASKVKQGRTLYLTINSSKPPKVKMPNLLDVSYRQAESILESFGLKVGAVTYKPDLAKNAVLDQVYRGSTVLPGVEIFKGSKIDLVLGDGAGNAQVEVPKLIGLTLDEATFVLRASSLSLGTVHFDQGVRDTINAKIYRQVPAEESTTPLSTGEAVSVFLR